MNKNISIAIVVTVVVVGGAFFLFNDRGISVVDMNEEEKELTALQVNLDLFAGDEALLTELDETLGDVDGTSGSVRGSDPLRSALLDGTAHQAYLFRESSGFTVDGSALQPYYQTFAEVMP